MEKISSNRYWVFHMYSEGNLLSTSTLASFWDTLWQELWPLMWCIAESRRINIWQARHFQNAEIMQLRPTGSATRPFHIFSIPLFRILHRRPTGSLPLKGIYAWSHRTGCKTQLIVGRRCALPPWGQTSLSTHAKLSRLHPNPNISQLGHTC